MRFLKSTHINFMAHRKVALTISLIVIIAGFASLAGRGLNYGLDFTGGTLIEVGFPAAPELSVVRKSLDDAGFNDAVVQTFGTARDIVVRLPSNEGQDSDAELSSQVLQALESGTGASVDMRRVEFVGPQIGDELKEKGGLAIIWALGGIFLYIMFRFQWRFSVGAVAALAHDIMVTLGVLSLVQIDFDLTVVAALLAVIGYSLNDTIVLYDRIRENFRRVRNRTPVEIVNLSINQTLARTVVTSLTTLLVLISLFTFGGEIIHSFAFTLIIGVLVGTYSSIYIASTAVLLLGVTKLDLAEVKKEGAGVGDQV